HRHDQGGSDRSPEPQGKKRSAKEFGPTGRGREEPARAEAELLEERPRTGQAVPAEPPEDLLRSMGRHQQSRRQSNEQESSCHVISLRFTITIRSPSVAIA